MKCPYCGYDSSKVVESRCADEGSRVRRRRECEHCSKRFTTYEVVEYIPLVVIKRGGTREKFERKKVFDGLLRACEKRAIPLEKVENMTDEIESELQNMLEREVKSSYIESNDKLAQAVKLLKEQNNDITGFAMMMDSKSQSENNNYAEMIRQYQNENKKISPEMIQMMMMSNMMPTF